MKTKDILKDIQLCAWQIIELAQDHKYKPRLKSLIDIGGMIWQITRGLVALQRRL